MSAKSTPSGLESRRLSMHTGPYWAASLLFGVLTLAAWFLPEITNASTDTQEWLRPIALVLFGALAVLSLLQARFGGGCLELNAHGWVECRAFGSTELPWTVASGFVVVRNGFAEYVAFIDADGGEPSLRRPQAAVQGRYHLERSEIAELMEEYRARAVDSRADTSGMAAHAAVAQAGRRRKVIGLSAGATTALVVLGSSLLHSTDPNIDQGLAGALELRQRDGETIAEIYDFATGRHDWEVQVKAIDLALYRRLKVEQRRRMEQKIEKSAVSE